MISFIIHLRKDTDERTKNINIVIPYFKSLIPDCEFIFIEDDREPHFEYLQEDNIYYYFKNEGTYNKCKSYNLGLKKSTREIVCFLDIDCIISKESLNKVIEQIQKTDGIYIGYNGTCIYFNYLIKNKIIQSDNLYEFLDSFVDKKNIYTMYKNERYTVANTAAVGGCLLGSRKIFNSINGFNPNFIGWGYEDNEIISRARILKVPVYAINTPKPYLFHLPHEIAEGRDKSNHEFYNNNHKEVTKIESMNIDELKQYIKTW
jgi:predicted glycosyltransferase involved in capsule biosynthesis